MIAIWILFICNLLAFIPVVELRESEKGIALGCYLNGHGSKHKQINGTHDRTDCIDICLDNYYRYALVNLDNNCTCSNFLSNIASNDECAKFCPGDCDNKRELIDVYKTDVRMNGPPRNLNILNLTATEVVVEWQEPESYSTIDAYIVKLNVLFSYGKATDPLSEYTFSNDADKATLSPLKPGSKYNMTMYTRSGTINGAESSLIFETPIAEPSHTPDPPKVYDKTDQATARIMLIPARNDNGPITSYLVIVLEEIGSLVPLLIGEAKSYREAEAERIPYYIAAELTPNQIGGDFVIGDRKVYGSYFNAPLAPDKQYKVVVGLVSRAGGREFRAYSSPTWISSSEDHVEHFQKKESPLQPDNDEALIKRAFLIVGIVVVSALIFLAIILILIMQKRIRRMERQRFNDNQELILTGPMIDVENHGYIPEGELNQTPATRATYLQNLSSCIWQIPNNDLNIDKTTLVANGTYGQVFAGTVQKNGQTQNVHVYYIPDREFDTAKKRRWLGDLDLIIKSIRHPNVVDLIGLCEQDLTSAVVVEATSEHLKGFLLNARQQNGGSFSALPEYKAMDLVHGIAKGMEHLHSKNIIHQRLCAMNIKIVDQQAKIFGFGLLQYYDKEEMPSYKRYTARECFCGGRKSVKSDVWEFAVVLWEIATLGATPYGDIPDGELADALTRANRLLPHLPYISVSLYQIMLHCWQIDKDERPTFTELREQLEAVPSEDGFNFNSFTGFKYEPHYSHLEQEKQ